MVLLFLAGIWGVVLYGYFKDRFAEARPADSIGSFRHQLSILERTSPSAVRAGTRPAVPAFTPAGPTALRTRPVPRTSPAKRRRDILFGLLAVMSGSLVLSFIPGLGVLRLFHLFVDALFVGYLALLIRRRNVRAEREMKLRFLPTTGAPEPALLLRRTGN